MSSSATRRGRVRPISVEHVEDAGHIVVHGTYGFVLVNGNIHAHVTFTWVAARPDTVLVTCTNPATGTNEVLYLGRNLLALGGSQRHIKVDLAGDLAFIVVSGDTRHSWMSLSRRWLADFIGAAEAIAPAQPSPDSGR